MGRVRGAVSAVYLATRGVVSTSLAAAYAQHAQGAQHAQHAQPSELWTMNWLMNARARVPESI